MEVINTSCVDCGYTFTLIRGSHKHVNDIIYKNQCTCCNEFTLFVVDWDQEVIFARTQMDDPEVKT